MHMHVMLFCVLQMFICKLIMPTHCLILLFFPTAQTVYLSHGSTHYYANNTAIIISSIMSTNDTSLICHTDSTTCCRGRDNPNVHNGFGEWFFPNETNIVRNSATGGGFYWMRDYQVLRLYRQGDIQTPLGTYCCRIPDSGGEMRTFCANFIGEFNETWLIFVNLSPTTATRCDPLMTAPDNGNVTYSNQLDDGKYIFGTIATYTCSPGYSLRSTENRTCITVDGGGTVGIFSASEPTCGRELAE